MLLKRYIEALMSITKRMRLGLNWGAPGGGGCSARRLKMLASPAIPSTILVSSKSPTRRIGYVQMCGRYTRVYV